ncbi:MIF4G like-domain-containing protein [Gorgonomyces haynaldii]|nr:MIF4G like-domain-containing protein [Gorgonomyces haynaldii]
MSRYSNYGNKKRPEKKDTSVSLLFEAGDPKSRDLSTIVALLEHEFQQDQKSFVDAWTVCVPQLPYKTTLLATISALLNARRLEIGQAIIQSLQQLLQDQLNKHHFRAAKITLRFLSECLNTNLIRSTSLVQLYDVFLEATLEPDVKQERSDMFVYLVMQCLPYIGKKLSEGPDLERIMNGLNQYMEKRQQKLAITGIQDAIRAMSHFRDCESGEPYPLIDRLQLLWNQIIGLQKSGWIVDLIPKPYESHKDILTDDKQHDVFKLSLPSPFGEPVRFDYEPVFYIFDESIGAGQDSAAHSGTREHLDRLILKDCIIDTIHIFSLNHKECARLLLEMDHYFTEGYVQTPIVYEVILESIFALAVALPKPQEKSVYYTTLLMDLCRESLDKIPSVLGRSLRTLFARMDIEHGGLDIQVINRLSELFSHHLSNFGYSWRWSDWELVFDLPDHSGRLVFVRETLERCIRLSYYERISSTLPDGYLNQPKAFPVRKPTFNYTYESESSCPDRTLLELAQELNRRLTAKQEEALIRESLQQIETHISASGDPAHAVQVARQVLMESVMFQGSKSFSHVLSVVERYIHLLQHLNSTPEAKQHSVQVIVQFWRDNTQFLEIILDKLVNYRVIDPKSIITFVVSPEVLSEHCSRIFVSNIIKNTIGKVVLKAEQLHLLLQTKKSEQPQDDMNDGDDLGALTEANEAAIREKKETLILVFQRFVHVLSQPGIEIPSPWWRFVCGLMREIGRHFADEINILKFTLDAVIFNEELDHRIGQVWVELKAMYLMHQSLQ